MSVITTVIVMVIYLKREKCCSVFSLSFIVFEGKNVLTVTVEGEVRVFQDSFYEKSLNLIIKEL